MNLLSTRIQMSFKLITYLWKFLITFFHNLLNLSETIYFSRWNYNNNTIIIATVLVGLLLTKDDFSSVGWQSQLE